MKCLRLCFLGSIYKYTYKYIFLQHITKESRRVGGTLMCSHRYFTRQLFVFHIFCLRLSSHKWIPATKFGQACDCGFSFLVVLSPQASVGPFEDSLNHLNHRNSCCTKKCLKKTVGSVHRALSLNCVLQCYRSLSRLPVSSNSPTMQNGTSQSNTATTLGPTNKVE